MRRFAPFLSLITDGWLKPQSMMAESSKQYIFAKSTRPIEVEDLSKWDPSLSEVELQVKFDG